MSLKTLESDAEIGFAEHILDTMLIPVRYLSILGVQYILGSAYSFSVTLEPKRLVYNVFLSINSSQHFLFFQQVLFSYIITSAQHRLHIMATLLDTRSTKNKN